MEKLEKIEQDGGGRLLKGTKGSVWADCLVLRVGKPQTLVVENKKRLKATMDEMADRNSAFIPREVNAYVASVFNPDTQFLIDERQFSVYAIQFYHLSP